MLCNLLADMVLICHFLFILFVIFGGLLLFLSKNYMYLHLPAVIWGASIEFLGWICPLTPLENRLREAANGSAYAGGFIGHYLMPVIYPDGLTRHIQILLGLAVLLINIVIYTSVIVHSRRKRE